MKKILIILSCVIVLSCTTIDNQEETEARIDALYGEFIVDPQSQPRLAIVPFVSTNIAKSDTMGIQLHFEASIHETEYFNLIEQSEAETILEAQAYSLNGCTDDECAIEIGKLLSAEQIIIGNVGTVGELFYLNIKLIDIETGKILVAKNLHSDSIEELLFLIYPDFSYSGFDNLNKKDEEKNDGINIIDFESDELGINVEYKTIIIDGIAEDWDGIETVELSKFDNNSYYRSFAISQDEQYIYMRIDILDDNLFTEELNHIFFNISPSINDFKGQINIGLTLDDGIWRKSIHQNIGDSTNGEENWTFTKLPQEYVMIKDVVEIKMKKSWLPGKNSNYISLGLHDGIVVEGLYFSDRTRIKL